MESMFVRCLSYGAVCVQVTFDPKIMTRSVTLDGDMFDPSGTLSGGKTRWDTFMQQSDDTQTQRVERQMERWITEWTDGRREGSMG